jgi:hypothetical protein
VPGNVTEHEGDLVARKPQAVVEVAAEKEPLIARLVDDLDGQSGLQRGEENPLNVLTEGGERARSGLALERGIALPGTEAAVPGGLEAILGGQAAIRAPGGVVIHASLSRCVTRLGGGVPALGVLLAVRASPGFLAEGVGIPTVVPTYHARRPGASRFAGSLWGAGNSMGASITATRCLRTKGRT